MGGVHSHAIHTCSTCVARWTSQGWCEYSPRAANHICEHGQSGGSDQNVGAAGFATGRKRRVSEGGWWYGSEVIRGWWYGSEVVRIGGDTGVVVRGWWYGW